MRFPVSVLREFEYDEHQRVEFYRDNGFLVLRKYEPEHKCVFCEGEIGLIDYQGRKICRICLNKLKEK